MLLVFWNYCFTNIASYCNSNTF